MALQQWRPLKVPLLWNRGILVINKQIMSEGNDEQSPMPNAADGPINDRPVVAQQQVYRRSRCHRCCRWLCDLTTPGCQCFSCVFCLMLLIILGLTLFIKYLQWRLKYGGTIWQAAFGTLAGWYSYHSKRNEKVYLWETKWGWPEMRAMVWRQNDSMISR